MFAYCNNNSVNSFDSFGLSPVSILERFGDTPIPAPPPKGRKSTSTNPANNMPSLKKLGSDLWKFYDEQYQRYVENQMQTAQLELQGAISIGKWVVDGFGNLPMADAVKGIDWDEVGRQTWGAALGAGTGGAFLAALIGAPAAPATGGVSVGALVIKGFIDGFISGAGAGFVTAVYLELTK